MQCAITPFARALPVRCVLAIGIAGMHLAMMNDMTNPNMVLRGYEGLTVSVGANGLTITRDGAERHETFTGLDAAYRVVALGCAGYLSPETFALCSGLLPLDVDALDHNGGVPPL